MDGPEPLLRRTATPAMLTPWLAEVARTLPGLIGSYGRRAALDPRTRERIILAVTEVNGCRYSAWIHGAWHDFLGEVDHLEATEAVLGYARTCAVAGRPLPPDELRDVLPQDAVRAVRATVAQTEVANLVGNTFDSVVARLAGRLPRTPFALYREVVTVAAATPVAIPLLTAAGVMRLVSRWAPPLPVVDMPAPDDANLLAHLLATASRAYLANAAARMIVLQLPGPVAVGLQSGRTAATVRFGRRALVIENGISSDALVVIEGDIEPLFEVATGSIVRELGSIRLRGH